LPVNEPFLHEAAKRRGQCRFVIAVGAAERGLADAGVMPDQGQNGEAAGTEIHIMGEADKCVFVIKSVVQDVSFATIFKGVIPFIITDIIRLIILIAFPILALYLPSQMR
jgi:hypothetical protein